MELARVLSRFTKWVSRALSPQLSSCIADHEQGWEPYPVDPYFCYMCGHTYIDIVLY